MKTQFTLNNGVKIPSIGFGSYKATENGKNVIKMALAAGYRYIDTARFYKNEKEIGDALEEYKNEVGLGREEIFLVSKVWPLDLGHEKTLESFNASLADLKTDYLDMNLIHWPKAHQNDEKQTELMIETWLTMEELYKNGKIKAIGLSNFLPHHIRPLLKIATVKPMIDQLELHVGYMQEYALDFLRKENIVAQAWSPLGRKRVLDDKRVTSLAKKYKRSPAQILLNYLLSRDICVIPKASAIERMKENLEVFDFALSEDEISYLSCIPETGWSGEHPDLMNL